MVVCPPGTEATVEMVDTVETEVVNAAVTEEEVGILKLVKGGLVGGTYGKNSRITPNVLI